MVDSDWGSALSLRINHRISEDLDVASRGNCLPSARLNALVRSFEEHGFQLVPTDDPAAAFEFESAGQELRDYQQDFLVNAKVKLSFFESDAFQTVSERQCLLIYVAQISLRCTRRAQGKHGEVVPGIVHGC
jgi:hypothetical protein